MPEPLLKSIEEDEKICHTDISKAGIAEEISEDMTLQGDAHKEIAVNCSNEVKTPIVPQNLGFSDVDAAAGVEPESQFNAAGDQAFDSDMIDVAIPVSANIESQISKGSNSAGQFHTGNDEDETPVAEEVGEESAPVVVEEEENQIDEKFYTGIQQDLVSSPVVQKDDGVSPDQE
jgi:hypothetical protein